MTGIVHEFSVCTKNANNVTACFIWWLSGAVCLLCCVVKAWMYSFVTLFTTACVSIQNHAFSPGFILASYMRIESYSFM